MAIANTLAELSSRASALAMSHSSKLLKRACRPSGRTTRQFSCTDRSKHMHDEAQMVWSPKQL
jgi:hypothetical protein